MTEQLNDNIDLDIRIDHIENDIKGTPAWVIHAHVYNQSSKMRRINLLYSTYITNYGEQIEQDGFQPGHIKGEDALRPNSFKRAGLEFYKSKLKTVSEADCIFISIELLDEGIRLTFSYQKNGNDWILLSREKDEIEIKLTPQQLERNILNSIERLEAFEERLGVSVQNISVKLSTAWKEIGAFHVFFEIHANDGTSIKERIIIQCVVYDYKGAVIETRPEYLYPDNFFGFQAIKIDFYGKGLANQVGKIRIYPTN